MAASFQSTLGCDETSFGERGNLSEEPSCDRECQSLCRLEGSPDRKVHEPSDVELSPHRARPSQTKLSQLKTALFRLG